MVGDIAGVGSREDGWDGVVEAVLGLGEAWAGIGRERVVETVRNAGSVDAAWRAVRYLRGLVSAGEPVNNARKLLARAMALEGEREAKADASRREEQEAVRQSKERTARMVEEQRALRAVVVAEMDAAKGEGAKREDGWDGVVETVLGLGEAWAGIGRERVVDTVRNAGSVDAAWRAVRYLRGLVSAGEPVSNARKLLARAMALEGEREAKADASRREEQEAVRRSKEETARRVEEKRARRALVLAEIEAAKGEGAKVEAAKRDGER
jgi:type VI protein secretion system component VasK